MNFRTRFLASIFDKEERKMHKIKSDSKAVFCDQEMKNFLTEIQFFRMFQMNVVQISKKQIRRSLSIIRVHSRSIFYSSRTTYHNDSLHFLNC